MEHMAKLQPCSSARLVSSASIHSDLPELGTPVMIVSSPGMTCGTTQTYHQCEDDAHVRCNEARTYLGRAAAFQSMFVLQQRKRMQCFG